MNGSTFKAPSKQYILVTVWLLCTFVLFLLMHLGCVCASNPCSRQGLHIKEQGWRAWYIFLDSFLSAWHTKNWKWDCNNIGARSALKKNSEHTEWFYSSISHAAI